MNWLLQGPFPLDTNNVAGSAKTALGAVDACLARVERIIFERWRFGS